MKNCILKGISNYLVKISGFHDISSFLGFFTPILWNDSQLPQIFSKIYSFSVTKIFVNKKFLIFRGIEESSRQNRVKKIPKIMKNHEISQFLPNNLRSPSGCNFLKILILKHDFNYSYCPIEGFSLIFTYVKL